MLQTYPFLSAAVTDRFSRKPRWERKTAHVDQILRVEKNVSDPMVVLQPGHILSTELDNAELIEHGTAPLWRVTLYSSPLEPDTTYLALAVAHVIVDGRGTLVLLSQMLHVEEAEDFSSRDGAQSTASSTSHVALSPKCEDTVYYHPRLLPLLKTAIQELLLPHLPAFLRDRLREKPAWPAHQPLSAKPKECSKCLVVLNFSSPNETAEGDLVAGLKLFAQKSGAGTVNSLVHTAGLAALLLITRSDSETERKRTGHSLRFATETAMSVRDPAKGHPLTTGNYVGSVAKAYDEDELLRETVWRTASKYHQSLHSSTGRKDAIGRMGMLRYIPDPAMSAKRTFERKGAQVFPCPTGWEQFWVDKENSQTPYRGSMGLSNLGIMPSPPPSSKGKLLAALKGVWFAQPPSPSGDPLIIDAVGCKVGGSASAKEQTHLGIVIGWRHGVLEEKLVAQFCGAVKSALLAFARAGREEGKGKGSIGREMTMIEFCGLL